MQKVGLQMRGSYLPEAFTKKLELLLGPEFDSFLASYDDTRLYGLRVNTLKIGVKPFQQLTSMELEPIPWAPTGFYYNEDDRPGKHPYYHAGLYYIQEPSAMAPVELLDVRPGDRVLDLCAAPGGKSTQIAAKLEGQGMLVTNDIHSDRVKALVKNIDLCGARNAVVLNEQPERLQQVCLGFFDKILIDAPCSGEGMFRKEEEMAKAWRPDWPQKYAAMQSDLLRQAAVMLKPGGRMVYSTCTFSPEENETRIAEFVSSHPDFQVVSVPADHGFRPGRPDWVEMPGAHDEMQERAVSEVEGTLRLWPHQVQGEGHFVAVLVKDVHAAAEAGINRDAILAASEQSLTQGRTSDKPVKLKKQRSSTHKPSMKQTPVPDLQPLYDFMRELAPETAIPHVTLQGDHVYAKPEGTPDWHGIRVVRQGWYLGMLRKQRFEPSQALAMGLKLEECGRTISIPLNDPSALRYLKGETVEIPQEQVRCADGLLPKGYVLVAIDGYPVGWGKWHEGMLKNEYQVGWRWI